MIKFYMRKKTLVILSCITLFCSSFFFNTSLVAKPFFGITHQLPLLRISEGESKILLNFTLPEGHEYALEAPSTVWVRIKDKDTLAVQPEQPKAESLDLSQLPYTINLNAKLGITVLVIDTRVHYCDKDTQICLTEQSRIKIPIEVTTHAPRSVAIHIPICSKVLVCKDPSLLSK